jgi:hypothetical protein
LNFTGYGIFKTLSTAMIFLVQWLMYVVLFQTLMLVLSLFNGALSYMGGTDANIINTAFAYYPGDILLLLGAVALTNTIVFYLISLPLALWTRYWKCRSGWKKIGLLFIFFLLIYYCWVSLACIRIPSLFSEIYYGDGSLFTARIMFWLCSRFGLILASMVALTFFILIWRGAATGLGREIRSGRLVREILFAGGLVLAAFMSYMVWNAENKTADISLPPRSVVLMVADSFRSDHFSSSGTPSLWLLAGEEKAVVLPDVVPPLPRTAPAINALLTGKLPPESGVTTMFSNESTFKQIPSVVSYYRAHGYCTVATGEYPAEFMSKFEYGFEYIDAPLVRFKEIVLQMFLKKNPFFLATMSWDFIRDLLPEKYSNILEGLPIFAAPNSMFVEFGRLVNKCGGRPVFAILFADQPHFPYVQTWPFYLNPPQQHSRFQYLADAYLTPRDDLERQQIRSLYQRALHSVDSTFSRYLRHWRNRGILQQSTVIVTGDHGESLYDRQGIIGHGDQLGEWEGINVPWLVFGAGRKAFTGMQETLVQNLHLIPLTGLPQKLLDLNQIGEKINPCGLDGEKPCLLDPGVIYVETGLWMAHTPNLPKNRIRYPDIAESLSVGDKNAQIVLKDQYQPVVEYAKHRLWVIDGDRYELLPLSNRLIFRKNNEEISFSLVPKIIRKFLHRIEFPLPEDME